MNFELSDEQKAVRDTFARFCDARIAPQAAALDEAKAFPRELFRELADLGFFGMRYPEAVGGSGMALAEFCLALGEVARLGQSAGKFSDQIQRAQDALTFINQYKALKAHTGGGHLATIGAVVGGPVGAGLGALGDTLGNPAKTIDRLAAMERLQYF